MKNLKVSTKLVIGYTLVLALLLIVAGMGSFGMSAIQERLQDITQVNNVKVTLAGKMIASVRNRAITIRNLAMATDDKTITAEVERIKPQQKIYADSYAQLGKLLDAHHNTTAKERELYAALKADEAAAAPMINKVVELGVANAPPATIVKYLIDDVRPVQAVWTDRLTELATFEDTLTEQASTEAAAIYQRLTVITFAVAASAILIGIVTAFLIVKSILGQLGGEPAYAQAVASEIAHGNLTVALNLKAGDETSLMAALEKMRYQLNEVVKGIKTSAESIATAASEIAQGNFDLSQRTEEQAASLEETASSMEELTSTVEHNTQNAQQASVVARSAAETSLKGGDVVQQVVKTMADISESSNKATEIITSVEAIAFQTNILALNAAVEAARAGDQGRGFAVVAGEVRTLAKRSAEAAKEIKDLIGTSVQQVATGAQLVSDAGKTMAEVVQSAENVTVIMNEIAAASREQSAGISQVNIAITQMDEVTQQNAALVEQATAAAQAMADQAEQLRASVAVFRVSTAERSNGADSEKVLRPKMPEKKRQSKPAAQPTTFDMNPDGTLSEWTTF
ncbi:Methyl-accepting chemotaxis protein II [compost metagenome]